MQDQHLFQAGSCDVGALALDIIGHPSPVAFQHCMASQLVKRGGGARSVSGKKQLSLQKIWRHSIAGRIMVCLLLKVKKEVMQFRLANFDTPPMIPEIPQCEFSLLDGAMVEVCSAPSGRSKHLELKLFVDGGKFGFQHSVDALKARTDRGSMLNFRILPSSILERLLLFMCINNYTFQHNISTVDELMFFWRTDTQVLWHR